MLFLGAGASIGAVANGKLKSIPTGPELGNLLSDKFLGGEEKSKTLAAIADYAVSEQDLSSVQGYIKDVFADFSPASFHLKIPTFKWAAIVTTNYDQLIEQAYGRTPNRLQKLVPFIKNTDRIEDLLRDRDSIPFIKLHGCVSHWNDSQVPFILTIDQYASHLANRARLFERFKSFAADLPVVFVGYRLEDQDLRQILNQIAADGGSRPRYYVVSPHPSERDVRLWEQKKILALSGTFADFLDELDHRIPEALRAVELKLHTHPIEKRFVSHSNLSQLAKSFLTRMM